MLLIGVVLTVMVAAVAVYMGRDYYTGLRGTMEQVVAPLHGFSQPPAGKGEKPGQKQENRPRKPGEEKNISVIFYTPETGEYSVLSGSGSLSEEGLAELLAAVAAQEKDFGLLPSGRVILSLTQSKRKTLLSVQNPGSRIPEENLPHVFDRFYRGDKSRTDSQGSFGLGLAITKEMTRRLGGTIAVTSGESEGTVFRVIFPH